MARFWALALVGRTPAFGTLDAMLDTLGDLARLARSGAHRPVLFAAFDLGAEEADPARHTFVGARIFRTCTATLEARLVFRGVTRLQHALVVGDG